MNNMIGKIISAIILVIILIAVLFQMQNWSALTETGKALYVVCILSISSGTFLFFKMNFLNKKDDGNDKQDTV